MIQQFLTMIYGQLRLQILDSLSVFISPQKGQELTSAKLVDLDEKNTDVGQHNDSDRGIWAPAMVSV